jgi:hypothetical protein
MLQLLVFVRCFERALIVFSGSLVCFLGFRLYAIGITDGNIDASWLNFAIKGPGAGLGFMLGGIGLLVQCLRTPIGVSAQSDRNGKTTKDALSILGDMEPPSFGQSVKPHGLPVNDNPVR